MSTKIAVITDVHANLPALQAALNALEQEGYDHLIHTGDAISFGPYPNETLDLLFATPNISLLMGNHDAWFVEGLPQYRKLPAWLVTHLQWTHAVLHPDFRPMLAQWPYLLEQQIEGVRLTFLHYALAPSGRDFTRIVFDATAADLDQLFAAYDADFIFYGHEHPFSDLQGRARYINPGALGCYKEPVARYCIVQIEHGKATIEHRSVAYDDTALFQAFDQFQMPSREEIYHTIYGK